MSPLDLGMAQAVEEVFVEASTPNSSKTSTNSPLTQNHRQLFGLGGVYNIDDRFERMC